VTTNSNWLMVIGCLLMVRLAHLLNFDKIMSDQQRLHCHSRESGNPVFRKGLDACHPREGGDYADMTRQAVVIICSNLSSQQPLANRIGEWPKTSRPSSS
jgi:hypothetical protein